MDEGAEIIKYSGVEILRQELVVLKQVDFTARAGEMVYLMGKVGSGKSSLLKSMYAEVPVEQGSASVLGYDLNKIRRREIPYLRRKIGIVFQDFQLLTDRTVSENLEFVLRATGLGKKAYKMPHELSGGEQQRIVIARALLNDPGLLLADEPTGNLDPETGEQIVSYLHAIARQGTTVIMATHNAALVEKYPARTLRCENKRVVE